MSFKLHIYTGKSGEGAHFSFIKVLTITLVTHVILKNLNFIVISVMIPHSNVRTTLRTGPSWEGQLQTDSRRVPGGFRADSGLRTPAPASNSTSNLTLSNL